MFNSLKKWVKNEEMEQRPGPPEGMQTMKSDLQRKFAKGVQYNLKIIIRGDRNTGKTCLWHRLQGHKFVEEYLPTAEIQVASIHWNYKATDDIVKVDVWDIVDEGKNSKKGRKGLKLVNDNEDPVTEQVLDASFLDVYKGAHAVILIFDITKKWTFSYIERELPKIPSHLPVLILANFRDMGHHRVITSYEVEGLVESTDRPTGSPSVMYYESSLKNGFGLRYVHKFFNMPFLLVQRESLLKQLETNHLDLESCVEELLSEEHSYETFDQMLKDKRTGKAVPSGPLTPEQAATSKSPGNSGPSIKSQPSKPEPPSTLGARKTVKESTSEVKISSPEGKKELFSPSQMEDQVPTASAPEEKRGFMSRFFRRSSGTETGVGRKSEVQLPASGKKQVSSETMKQDTDIRPVTNVEEFMPEEGSVDDFLNDTSDYKERTTTAAFDSSDDETSGGNPMVSGFQEELDSDDQASATPNQKVYSSSDSDIGESLPKATALSEKKAPPPRGQIRPKHTETPYVVSAGHSDSSSDGFTRPEVTQDADLSSDDISHGRYPEVMNADMSSDEDTPEYKTKLQNTSEFYTHENDVYKTDVMADQLKKRAVFETKSESEDLKINTMVSATYDDLSPAEEEAMSAPPVAIVTPLQVERKDSWNNGDSASDSDLKPAGAGLNLELDAADLDFLERNTKTAEGETHRSERKKSSKDSQEKGSRRSSKFKDDGVEDHSSRRSHGHRKHKKHRSKDTEKQPKERTPTERSHRLKEDGERRKKKKSRTTGTGSNVKAANDLEAFLNDGT